MRRFALACAFLACFSWILRPLSACAQASYVRLPQGTPISLRPQSEISSGKVKTGETVNFVVTQPVKIQGVTLIENGAIARGTVTKARHAGGFGRNGELNLSIDSVQAIDGTMIKLRASSDNKGADNAALSIGLAVLVSVFAVFIQGREAVVPVSKEFNVFINEDKDFALVPNQIGTGYIATAVPGQAMPQQGLPQAGPPQPLGQPMPGNPQISTQTVTQGTRDFGIVQVLVCKQVDSSGTPVEASNKFTVSTPTISVWWKVQPAAQDRVYEVRWSRGDHVETTSKAIVRGNQTSGWSTISQPSIEGFPKGQWNVTVFLNGQVQTTQSFMVGF